MPLESATYIPDLDPNWPLGSDSVAEGDDHLRMIKAVLQNSFLGDDYPYDLDKLGAMVGEVRMYGAPTPPEGWFNCDGSELSRVDYADLYSVIGTTFGDGDGSTSFNLPDFRDQVPGGFSVDNDIGATEGKDEWTAADLPAHNHTTGNDTHTHNLLIKDASGYGPGDYIDWTDQQTDGNPGGYENSGGPNNTLQLVQSDTHNHSVSSTGSGGDNRQATTYINFIIKT